MKHFVIGTAGHVDHGKTMLVKALTGKDTDRLKEEKERGISIELGFAALDLASGNRASIIDVPGHERFIKNMLAGVGGIDLVLFVIAADEGIMPQTREHLDIIELLQVEKGIVVITKTDMVDDDWRQLIREEINEFLQGTFLEKAPVVEVSVVNGAGIDQLKSLIDEMIDNIKPKEFTGRPRMPIDRVFSITGFGTVVTGTMLTGQVKVGDALEILPKGIESRVRSLQVHGEKVETATAGQRVAINLTGVEVSDISRGNVLTEPHTLQSSYHLDAELTLLSDAEKGLANRARIRFHIGTKEALGRVVLLDREELKPGERAFVQFELEESVVSGKNDRYVIRTYSPLRTVGGGAIIDPNPKKHKRFQPEVISNLKTRQKGSPDELIEQYLVGKAVIILPYAAIAKETDIEADVINEAVKELVQTGKIKLMTMEGTEYIIPMNIYKSQIATLKDLLTKYHQEYPLRVGYPKEELRSRFFNGLHAKLFNFILQALIEDEIILVTDKFISLFDYRPTPDQKQQKILENIADNYRSAEFQPPGWRELAEQLKLPKEEADELIAYLLDKKLLIKIGEDFYLHQEVLEAGLDKIKTYLQQKGETTLGEVRDILSTSRKYALPLLEYLDYHKITRRVGDKRVLY